MSTRKLSDITVENILNLTRTGKIISPAFEMGVRGPDLPSLETFDLLYVLPPFADTGVLKGLFTMLEYPGLLLHDSPSLSLMLLFRFKH